MATGPEHYREAERIVSLIDQGRIGQDMANSLAKAQVHATLALAAATALNDADGGAPVADWDAWKAVAGEDAAQRERAKQAARDAEDPPTTSEMRAMFGEPVEGRDYDVMPGGES